jgi:hypothetical protein
VRREIPCPDCGATGRNQAIIARSEAHGDAPAYEGPAQCDRCAGTGALPASRPVPVLRIPADHPRAAEIAALLAEGGDSK